MTNGADIFPLKTQAFRLTPHASRLTPLGFSSSKLPQILTFNLTDKQRA
jgi:hypothetical protein